MPYPNEHAARLRAPSEFSSKTFRRTKGSGKGKVQGVAVPATISIIWGKLKGKDKANDPPIAQALRFPIKSWTASKARDWLKTNKIKYLVFEPAAKPKKKKKEKKMDKKTEVKKFFKDLADGKDPIEKQEQQAVLLNKTANIEPAENGMILRICEEWEIPATAEKRRDWRWFEKRYIGANFEELLPIIETEMQVKKGSKITLAQLADRENSSPKPEIAKGVGVMKRNLAFATGEQDGHLHLAYGEIEDRIEDNEIVKYFIGETLPDKVFFSMEGSPQDFQGKMVAEVTETLESHIHKFAIKMDKDDDSRSRIIGSTDKVGEHWHSIHIIDLVSEPVQNSPDK